ncbi:hypothetical protein ACQEVF_50250 [Nonomuraea polychroma]|uniref:hypothetical protein n=1 Tax=Nonomuraea polychroma TaxID=46176 RepID=UPI003D8F5BB0
MARTRRPTPEEARRLCEDAAHGIAPTLRDIEFAERHLVETLLDTEIRRAVKRTFTASYENPGRIRKSAGGVATFFSCGMWRPRWSKRARPPVRRPLLLPTCGLRVLPLLRVLRLLALTCVFSLSKRHWTMFGH